jgi:hypothetical protein
VKRLRSQSHSAAVATAAASGSNFDTTSAPEADNGKRQVLDFDALVANFEQGLGLQKLRAELEASKKSMERSSNTIKQMAAEYSMGGKASSGKRK